MKFLKSFLWILLIGMFIMAPVSAFAQDCKGCATGCDEEGGLSIKGDFRWRGEANGKDFNKDTDLATYSSLRARLGFVYKTEAVKGVFQIQYPHVLGWDSGNIDADSMGILDVHQAYLQLQLPHLKCVDFKAGRFEMAYGDERLIGSVGWDNIGRTFDGMMFSYKNEAFWGDLFFTKQAENSDPESVLGKEKDDLFMGFWGGLKPMNLNLFALYNRNVDPTNDFKVNLSRYTMGLHYWKFYEDFNLAVLTDFAYQMGTGETSDIDLGAWMAVLSLGYKIDLGPGFWLGAGFDMTSGDDPTSADKNEGFSNLYYTGHKWRGYMDFFVADDIFDDGTNPGVRDIFVNAIVNSPFMEGCHLELEFHLFNTMQDFVSAGEEVNGLGNELNVVRVQKMDNGLEWQLGLGYFMPSEDWKGADADNALWAFIQFNKAFNLK